MRKLIIGIILLLLLTSCGLTPKEVLQKQEDCKLIGMETYVWEDFGLNARCEKKDDDFTVQNCLNEYTDGLNEKYNNPDTVSNLREDEYSKVVITCNEIFGNKEKGKN